MSDQQFQVVVNGSLVEGAELDQVKQKIAALFKTSLDKVEPMFSGRKMAVKKGLDQQTAQKYKAAIIKAGLAAAIAPMAGAETAAPAKPATGTPAEIDASLAEVGSTMDETPPPPPADIDTSGMSMGEAGEQLADTEAVAEPDIDISSMTMGQVGEDVMEYQETPEPEIDTSELDMAEVGADVTEHEAVPDANIDTSELSMADVGADVTEHKEVPPANIDTSELSLDEESK